MSEQPRFRIPRPPLMTPEKARDIARSYQGLAEQFAETGAQRSHDRAMRDSQWWLTYALRLAHTAKDQDAPGQGA